MTVDGVIAAGASDLGPVLLEFGALLLGLGLLARLAYRLKISSVPFYIVGGLAFGEGGVWDLGVDTVFLRATAEIGAILLLLLLGLEYSARELVDTVRRDWTNGVVDLVLNAAPGALLGWALGWGAVGALALGGITYVSSSGIVSQLIREFGWRGRPETGRVVAVLVVEDVVMAPYLPLLSALALGAGLVGGLVSVGVALVVVGLVVLVGVRRDGVVGRLLDPSEPTSLLLTVFGAAVLCAGAAVLAGFSAAVAAFLVGLLLTGDVAEVARRRLGPLRDLFAAIFFVFFGLVTDPREIPGVAAVAIGLAVVGVGTKVATGWWITRDLVEPRSAWHAGGLLTARGEFSVVIAGLVATSGAVTGQIEALTATYVLVTAAAAPFLGRFLDRRGAPPGDHPLTAPPST